MITRQEQFEAAQREWLATQFDELTDEIEFMSPSEWAEQNRYLPPAVTPLPGLYSFEVAPHIREILDCLDMSCSVREIAVMKGAQICATSGILENGIGYFIARVRTAPVMMVTADAELAKLRMTSYVMPMVQESGLTDLIQSSDEKNARKTGQTDKKLEWIGGGSLVPFGAQSANKMRSITAQVLLNDEVDGWPPVVGDDGDPVVLIRARAKAYEASRKVVDLSTPKIQGHSKIESLFKRGDQRYYNVKCLECGHPQVLRWTRTNKETGEITGITWDMDDDRLVPGSVRYLCSECGHAHTENDKPRLFAADNAEWVPTANPIAPDIRSYHISALYSPVGMQSWEMCVRDWVECWDVAKATPKDLAKLQVFYNNILGETFELRGQKLRMENVSAHRRTVYRYGEIPNEFAEEFCEGPVLFLTCAVDVHQDSLKVAVIGWCRDRRTFLVQYDTFEGDPEQVDDHATWGRLTSLIENREWIADDGKRYRVTVTFIDSGFLTDTVYRFCHNWQDGVFPVKGRATPPRGAAQKEFSDFTTPTGIIAFGITVDMYKDRWSAALRRSWDGVGVQPAGHFNAPMDVEEKQLKELTVEVKRERIERATGKRLGAEWHRPQHSANELWDLLVYSAAAVDMMALNISKMAGLESTNWKVFWDVCESGRFYEGQVPDADR